MSFGLDTRNIKGIGSHAQAQAYFEATKPWRGRDAGKRPLDKNRRKHHCAIQKINNGYQKINNGYACVLYETPLVTFHHTGTVTVRCYPSKSSMAFIWAVLRIPVHMAHPVGYAIELGGKIYQVRGSEISIRHNPTTGAWEPIDLNQTTAWTELRVDAKRRNKIRQSIGYDDFAAWWRAARALRPVERYYHAGRIDMLHLVAQGRSVWVEQRLHETPVALAVLDQQIRSQSIVEGTQHPYLIGWREVNRLRRQATRLNRS